MIENKMTDAMIVNNNYVVIDFMKSKFSIDDNLFIMINERKCNEIRVIPIRDSEVYKVWIKMKKYSSGSIERALKHHGIGNIIFTSGVSSNEDYYTYECYFYHSDVNTSIDSLTSEILNSVDVTDILCEKID